MPGTCQHSSLTYLTATPCSRALFCAGNHCNHSRTKNMTKRELEWKQWRITTFLERMQAATEKKNTAARVVNVPPAAQAPSNFERNCHSAGPSKAGGAEPNGNEAPNGFFKP